MENQIKSFEDACKKLGLDPSALPVVTMLPAKHQKAITAHCKLVIIAEALNDGWQPDWSKSSQWKYYPWFYVDADKKTPSGSGFSYYGCDGDHSRTGVGSRLCFETSELAEYAGKQFKDLYEEYFLI